MNEQLKAFISKANHSPYISIGARVAARNIMEIEHLGVDEAALIVGRLLQRAQLRKVADIGGTAEALEECLEALKGVSEDQPTAAEAPPQEA